MAQQISAMCGSITWQADTEERASNRSVRSKPKYHTATGNQPYRMPENKRLRVLYCGADL